MSSQILPDKYIVITEREKCDLELLLNGGFKPLDGFMNNFDYSNVVLNMKLSNNKLFPLPVTLAIDELTFQDIRNEKQLLLRDNTLFPLAKIDIKDIYVPDKEQECLFCYGTTDMNHPYVKIVMDKKRRYYVGGKITKINNINHIDFKEFRMTPDETKKYFSDNKWTKVVGFQTRNPMHRCHYELTKYALNKAGNDSKLLLQPVVGLTQSVDVNYHTRVKCYKKMLSYYKNDNVDVLLNLLPLQMRMAGPREALLHALVRKNYGCTHFVIGRDHAGPSFKTKDGQSFYGAYDAQNLVEKYSDELGIKVITSKLISYVPKLDKYLPLDEVPKDMETKNISGTEQRKLLKEGKLIPSWFTFPEIAKELALSFNQGICVYLVGLSGSGKSTIANRLKSRLLEDDRFGNKKISIIDGDIIRLNLAPLGFSKKDRSINVRRIGYVASEIVKHGGIAICANIAPYEEDREHNRKLISNHGKYLEVYVNTKLKDCEDRDVKGLYKLARANKIKEFTGISDPFEEPKCADLKVDGGNDQSLDGNINQIINKILE